MAIAGIEEVDVGDTIVDVDPGWETRALPRIHVEQPTIKMRVGVNTSPLAGKSKATKFLTSRHLRDRLMREITKNLAIRVEETESPDTFVVLGRGELQLAILVETMRREGYELQLGNPEVVTQTVDGTLCEPMELIIVDVPEQFIGIVTERLGERRGRMQKMANHGFGRARLEYRVPSRGMIGFRGELLTATRGTALLNSMFDGWEPWGGTMMKRMTGAIVSDRAGVTTPYALHHLQPRGSFFIAPGSIVYEGMIAGEHNRPNDTDVNVIKEKKLSNVRNHGKDDNVLLAPPRSLTIETAMEWIDADELVEVTPEAVRVRKVILEINKRPRRSEAIEDAQGVEVTRGPGAPAALAVGTAVWLGAVRALGSSSADELVRQARAHEAAHDEDVAVRRYMEALEIEPTSADAWMGLGALRLRLGDAAEAERVFSSALERVPALSAALEGRARARWALGRHGDAEADLEAYAGAVRSQATLRELARWYAVDGRTPPELAVWRRLLDDALERGDAAAEREARRMVRALVILVDGSDPAASPFDPDPTRRALAAIARRGG